MIKKLDLIESDEHLLFTIQTEKKETNSIENDQIRP